jgi:signal transduction histidine kinase
MKRALLTSIILCLFRTSFSQSDPEIIKGITQGPDSARINFIIDNYYEIYALGFEEADTTMQLLIQLAQKNKMNEEEAYGFLYRGVINYLSGKYDLALNYYLTALRKFGEINSLRGIGRTYNELAVFQHKNQNLAKAYEALDSAYLHCKEVNDLECMGTSLSHRGTFLVRKGKYEEARPIFLKVLEIRKEMKDSIGLGYVYLDLAEYEAQNGNVTEAVKLINRSTEIRKSINDKQGLAVNTVIIGETYFGAENYDSAIVYFNKTLDLARPIGYTDLMRFSFDMIEKSFLAKNDYQKAYTSLQNSNHLKDSLFSIEKTKSITEMQTKYETEKKEKQIVVQQAEIDVQQAKNKQNIIVIVALILISTLLVLLFILFRNRVKKKQLLLIQERDLKVKQAQIEATLSSEERERKRFAEDLHDGFGQLISALRLNMNNFNVEGDEEKLKAFEHSEKILDDMHTEIRAIAFNLMPVTLIEHGVLAAIKEFSARITKSKQLKIEVSSFKLNTRFSEIFEVAIYRIVQEWVNNVIKYADAKKITIQLDQYEDELVLIIEDDGNGFDKTVLLESQGNGWKNIQTRANLIKSEI